MITYFFIAPKGFFENMSASDYLSIQTKYCMADRDLVHKDKPQHLQSPPTGKNYLLAIAINDYQQIFKTHQARQTPG